MPNELFFMIGENLSVEDLYMFLSTSQYLSSLLTPLLYNHVLRDIDASSALPWAAERGSASVAELAISRGADINKPYGCAPEYWGQTPLHSAAFYNNPHVIRILVAHGATIDIQARYGETPLHQAAISGAVEAIEVLLELGADTSCVKGWDGTAAHIVASLGRVSCMEAFVDAGFDLNTRGPLRETLLHNAATEWMGDRAKRYSMVKYLLGQKEVREAINAQDYSGSTALHLAPPGVKTVRLLLRHGADMGVKDTLGRTPAHMAAVHGDLGFESLKAIIDAGFDITARENDGRTVLHHAATKIRNGESKIVEYLLEQPKVEFIINAQDSEGLTPLAWAATAMPCPERERVISLLVLHGADMEIKDIHGDTPAERICRGPDSDSDSEW